MENTSDIHDVELHDFVDFFFDQDVQTGRYSHSDSDSDGIRPVKNERDSTGSSSHSSPSQDSPDSAPKKRKNNPDAEEIARATEQSIIDLGIEPNSVEAKKARRQIRNRLSAQFHRNRKNEHTKNLEAENNQLKAQLAEARRENRSLHEKITILTIENNKLFEERKLSHSPIGGTNIAAGSNIDSRKYSGSFTDSEYSSPDHSPAGAAHGVASQSMDYLIPTHYPPGSLSPLSTSSLASTSPVLSSINGSSSPTHAPLNSHMSMPPVGTIPSTGLSAQLSTEFYQHSLVPVGLPNMPLGFAQGQYNLMSQSFPHHPSSMTSLGTPLPSAALNPSSHTHSNIPGLIHPTLLPPSISLQATFHPGHPGTQRKVPGTSSSTLAAAKKHALLFSVLCVICLSHFIPSAMTVTSPYQFFSDLKERFIYNAGTLKDNQVSSVIESPLPTAVDSRVLSASTPERDSGSLNINKLNEKISHDFKKFFEEFLTVNPDEDPDSRRLSSDEDLLDSILTEGEEVDAEYEEEGENEPESETQVEDTLSASSEKTKKKNKNLRNLSARRNSTIEVNIRHLNQLIHTKMRQNFQSMVSKFKLSLNLNLNKTLSTLSSGTTNYTNSGQLTTSSSLFNGNFFEQDWFDFALSNENEDLISDKVVSGSWFDSPSKIIYEDGYVIVDQEFSLSSPAKKPTVEVERERERLETSTKGHDDLSDDSKSKNSLSHKFSRFFNELEASINEAESNLKRSNFNLNNLFNKKLSKKDSGEVLTFTVPASHIKIAKRQSLSGAAGETQTHPSPSLLSADSAEHLDAPDVATIGQLFSSASVPLNQVPMIATESGLVPSPYLLNKEKELLKQQEVDKLKEFSLDQLNVEFKCMIVDTRVVQKPH